MPLPAATDGALWALLARQPGPLGAALAKLDDAAGERLRTSVLTLIDAFAKTDETGRRSVEAAYDLVLASRPTA